MIRSLGDLHPQIAPTAYVDASAQVIGDVVIGEHSSIWPGAVLRGDLMPIRIGAYSNIQDNCIVHVEIDLYGVIVEDRVTVGHGVILHGCHIERRCLIGMGAIILNDVRIGSGSIVAAGSVVAEHTVIPPGSLVMGVPGTVRRPVTEEELARIDQGPKAYFRLKERFRSQFGGDSQPG